MAYLFELYESEGRKYRKWVLGLFLISILSTMSTTGYVVAIALFIATVGKTKGKSSAIKIIFAMFAIIVLGIYMVPQLSGYWKYMIVDKINQILNYQPGISTEASSRMDSVYYIVKSFAKSPLWGIGTTGYISLKEVVGHSMFTCTPLNWFATYGILWGGFVFLNLWKMLRRFIMSQFEVFLALLILCISVFSEELSTNMFFWILIFYGYISSKFNYLKNNKE